MIYFYILNNYCLIYKIKVGEKCDKDKKYRLITMPYIIFFVIFLKCVEYS